MFVIVIQAGCHQSKVLTDIPSSNLDNQKFCPKIVVKFVKTNWKRRNKNRLFDRISGIEEKKLTKRLL